ncbi:hypothetical protein LX59_02479 [Azomonas agilis]|uniref:Uncharacterized protein n=1 Tax=Azomonas agilis TaxID=116849 RepID=A0A562I125_9GAMM|nr:hypothetical protein [Azomonas agilis]TWH64526.1 hypothetical protein LX59_02479 [Azomonas agilis]
MSVTLTAGLLLVGFFLLLIIAYINNLVEGNKLKLARQRAALTDRVRRCAVLELSLPEQMLTPKLRMLLATLELYWSEGLLEGNKKGTKLRERVQYLRQLIASATEADESAADVTEPEQEHSEASSNTPAQVRVSIGQIHTESQFNEIRYLLEDLYSLITTAGKESVISFAEVKYWQQEIKFLSSLLYLEYIANLGQLALNRKQFAKARQFFEQAIRYLSKKTTFPQREQRLEQLEQWLGQATAALLKQQLGAETTQTESLEQVQASAETPVIAKPKKQDEDDLWKKKNFYD